MLHEFLFGFLCKKYALPFFIWRKLQRFSKHGTTSWGMGLLMRQELTSSVNLVIILYDKEKNFFPQI